MASEGEAVRQFMETTGVEEKVAKFFVERSRFPPVSPVQCSASAVLCPA